MKASGHISANDIDWNSLMLRLVDWGIKHFRMSDELVITGTGETLDTAAVDAVMYLSDKLGEEKYRPKTQDDCFYLARKIMKHKVIDLFRKRDRRQTAPIEDMTEIQKQEVEAAVVYTPTVLDDLEDDEKAEFYYQFANDDQELKDVLDAVVYCHALKAREIAEVVVISDKEYQRRKKRLIYNRNRKKTRGQR